MREQLGALFGILKELWEESENNPQELTAHELALYADSLLLLTEASYFIPVSEDAVEDEPAGYFFSKLTRSSKKKKSSIVSATKTTSNLFKPLPNKNKKSNFTFSSYVKNKK